MTRQSAGGASAWSRPARGAWLLGIALLALTLSAAGLSACGQKGQLYLPGQKKSKVPPNQQPQNTPPPGTTPAPQTAPAPS